MWMLRFAQHERQRECGCFTALRSVQHECASHHIAEHTSSAHFFSVHSLKFNYQHNPDLSMLCSSAWKYALLIWLRLASKTL